MGRVSTNISSPEGATITALTDSTTGAVSNTINDTTASVKDDLAALGGKINEIIVVLRAIGAIL